MTLQEALAESDIKKRVDNLKKGRLQPEPNIVCIKQQWDPSQHAIFNTADRPDKTVTVDVVTEGTGTIRQTTRIEKVARISLAIQKLIVRRAASFLFGNAVKVISSVPESKVALAVDRILATVKQKGLNRRIARTLFASTEVAEYWYTVEAGKGFNKYGFPSERKVKVAMFSPLAGDELFPFFDDTGDMVAFSRQFKKKVLDKELQHFETWTADQYFLLRQDQDGWQEITPADAVIPIGKIPVVYASQEEPEWLNVQHMIERLEKLMSNFADTNDYHGAPKILAVGKVEGFSKKGESGAILEMENGSDAKYLSWDHAPESIKFEVENLLRQIFSITQTPDISFDAVKGLGAAASGQSLRMLFLDAHLKVMDKLEIFDDYLERRFSILKAFVAQLNTSLRGEADNVELTPEVVPYMVDDVKDEIDNLVTAVTGGIMSTETAVSKNPLVDDPKAELDLIKNEKQAAMQSAMELDAAQNEREE